jgi:hypothetical protein
MAALQPRLFPFGPNTALPDPFIASCAAALLSDPKMAGALRLVSRGARAGVGALVTEMRICVPSDDASPGMGRFPGLQVLRGLQELMSAVIHCLLPP